MLYHSHPQPPCRTTEGLIWFESQGYYTLHFGLFQTRIVEKSWKNHLLKPFLSLRHTASGAVGGGFEPRRAHLFLSLVQKSPELKGIAHSWFFPFFVTGNTKKRHIELKNWQFLHFFLFPDKTALANAWRNNRIHHDLLGTTLMAFGMEISEIRSK